MASLVIAKIMVPERKVSKTREQVRVEVPRQGRNVIDAACNGAAIGLKLALNVGAMVPAFVCLIDASPATTANMYADITFEDMQNRLNGLHQ